MLNIMNKLIKLIKRIIISSFLLYGYNILVQPIGLVIPINIFTVISISILGMPALMALIFVLVFIY